MRNYLLFTFILCFAAMGAMAQKRTVTGTVREKSTQEPIPGASVLEKGTTNGTITASDGSFRISVDHGATLVFSFLGMSQTEIIVKNDNPLEVFLAPSAEEIDEVVVTAMGITRDKKNLTYAVQKIEGKDLTDANQSNLTNSLQGQIAGAQISSSGGSPGLPSEIILRGSSTLTGDNQPLVIVDGIRVSNASVEGTSNRLSDFNPDDIENISILKGAAASALYGIDAASGAIIITTKKGTSGKIKINASYKGAMETVGKLPEMQKLYTTGYNGSFDESSSVSWGRKYRSDEKIYNNLDRYFKTGLNNDVNLSISGGSDKVNYYMSGNYRKGTSTIRNTDTEKLSLLLKGNTKLRKNLELTTSINYITSDTQEGVVGSTSGGWLLSLLSYPLRYDVLDYQEDNGDPHYEYIEDDDVENATISPLWSVMENPRNTEVNRTVVNANLVYKPLNWLTLSYRIGQDFFNQNYSYIIVEGTPGSYSDGRLYQSKGNYTNVSNIFNATIDKKLSDSFRTTLIAGGSEEFYKGQSVSTTGLGFLVPGVYSVNNIDNEDITLTESDRQRRRYAVYGDYKLEFRNIATLGITARNDWSSTLNPENRSFFSSSLSGSFTFSELFSNRKEWYAKLRGSYAKVGKDAPIYATNTTLTQYAGYGGGYVNSTTGGNYNLEPEKTEEIEIGLDMKLFRGRLNLDASVYNRKTIDQIITTRVPLTTGSVIQTFNAGSLRNRGLEISMNGTPIKKANFKWNVTVNAWKNVSKMIEFPGDIITFPYTYAQLSAGTAASVLGKSVLGITGTDYERNDEGYVIIDEDGYPSIGDDDQYIGNREPDFNIGLLNKFNYKNLSLSFMWDFRLGGDVLNATRQRMMTYGTAADVGEWRDKQFTFNGVVEQADGSYIKNETPAVLDYSFFSNIYNSVGTNFVETVNWARVRYITLGYKLPKSLYSDLNIQNVQIELSAQNPILITNYSGGDPEVNSAGPNAGGSGASTMGVDYGSVPLSKSYSIGIVVAF